MKRAKKKISTPPLPWLVTLLSIGYGAGYTTNEWMPQSQTPNQVNAQPASFPKESIDVCFTPDKRCQSKIINEIGIAKKSIYVQAYSFTDKDIATALVNAAARGVEVKVILDKSNRNDDRSAKSILLSQKIPLRFDTPNGIAHNKIMILDEAKVISGSYNFSVAAYKRNTENLLVINNAPLAHSYIQNWQTRWGRSK